MSPAEIARLENILGNLGYSAPRPAAVGSRLPDAANLLDEGFVSRAAAANDERLLANMMRENDTRGLTNAINENDALVLRNAKRENDMRNALNARADGSDQFFFDVNPAMRYMDPDEAANIIRRPGGQTVYPPGFMSADEAADVIRPGPRVAATPPRFTPTAAGVRSIVGAGAGIPLALLPFADLPSGGGIDTVERGGVGPSAKLDQMVKTPTGADITRADRARMRQGYGEASQLAAKAVAEKRDAEWSALTDAEPAAGVEYGTVKIRDGVPVKRNEFGAIVPLFNPNEPRLPPEPEFVPPVLPDNYSVDSDVPVVEADVSKVMPEDKSLTAQELKDAEAAFMDPAEVAKREAATNKPESEFGSYTRFPAGSAGDEVDTAAPAAGTKFTPGPGQFVGTNGYIYEQSSDGSFENVGRVPGYTPAQLSEAANKGAFRDPNNIVVGSGKRTKKDTTDSQASSSGSSKKRKPKDETDTGTGGTGTGGTGTDGTGTGGTGTSPYTPEMQAMLDALYGNYMRQYNGPGVGYVPGVDPERNYFTPAFADGGLVDGRLVLGDGGPKEDKIPAMIDGVEQAKLSNGEFVMTAAAVKNAGGGDIELGAKRLMDLNNMLSYGKPADQLKVQHVK
jgi:hypothetical protein